MRYVVFDIETKNIFADVGKRDPLLLDIAVVALYDSTTDSYTSYVEEEFGTMWPIIEQTDVLIGFNSDHFDIPLLNKYYQGDLTQIKSIDILKTIFKTLGRRIGLDAVAQATLGLKKTGHGLQATQWWREGKVDQVRKYCIDDVKVTHELYKYMQNNHCIKYHDGKNTVKLDIDCKDWDEIEKTKMTMSLPF